MRARVWEGRLQRLREVARRAGMASVPTPVLVAGMALVSVAVVAALLRWWPHPADEAPLEVVHAQHSAAAPARGARASGEATSRGTADAQAVWVYVVGAVEHPGVYRLAQGARIEAAVNAAGGLKSDAAAEAVNLAAKATDGEQIAVPTRAEVKAGGGPASAGPSASAGGGSGGDGAPSAGGAGGKIDLNTADATQLDSLPGVGPATAARIVADRQSNGPFASVDDLGRVSGIGPKKLEQLKPLVSVR